MSRKPSPQGRGVAKIPEDREVLESPCAFVWIDDDGIINILNKEDVTITFEQHKLTYDNLKVLARGKRHPTLVDLRPIRSMDKASRDYSAAEEHEEIMSAVALIVGNPLSRALGNFFLGLNVPPFPVKLFSDEEKARRWLKQR